ncbi:MULTISPECIES: helix-turn-helix domain-containing protein [Bacteria]|uniref:helix-turn-helix domain-containing protein n=1 Tax=Bacteria TaxID=2 RepID=UPI003C7E8891
MLGWENDDAGPGRYSVELTQHRSWTVSRVWSTGGVLSSRSLPHGTVRVIVGVDGEAEIRGVQGADRLRPRQLIFVDGVVPLETANRGIWARAEWHLRAPAFTLDRFIAHHGRPLPLPTDHYDLFTTMTNVISTRPSLGQSPGAELLLDVLTGVVTSGVINAAHESASLSSAQVKILRDAYAAIDEHYADATFSVQTLAAHVSVSTFYLHRLFAASGTTPRRAIEARRIRAASVLLNTTNPESPGAYEDVARVTGFSSGRQMRMAFRRNGG